jgi:hypothetical protein
MGLGGSPACPEPSPAALVPWWLGLARCTATPAMTTAMPVRLHMVETWPKTIGPAVVAVTGS